MINSINSIERAVFHHFIKLKPNDVAEIINSVRKDEYENVIPLIGERDFAKILPYLQYDVATAILDTCTAELFASIIKISDTQVAASILDQCNEAKLNELFNNLPPNQAADIKTMMSYPAQSAGSLMETRPLVFSSSASVKDALKTLRTHKHRNQSEVFIVDGNGKFLGQIPLAELALADPKQQIASLVQPAISVNAFTQQDEVIQLMEAHHLSSLAVLSIDGRILGVIKAQKIISAAQEEAISAAVMMTGADPNERALSSPIEAVKKRLPWLAVNLITAFLASSVVSLFEHTLAQLTALAITMPIVAGQAGNTGAQANAVAMRALALREIRVKDFMRILLKEVLTGLINGLAIGSIAIIGVYLWSTNAALSAVLGVAMVVSLIVASAAGAATPILLAAFNKDPAQSSSVILTTITDCIGFLSYLGFATLALSYIKN